MIANLIALSAAPIAEEDGNLLVTLSAILFLISAIADLWQVYKRDLMMLQQNSYRNERYIRWFNDSNESTNLGRIFCCIGLLLLLVHRIPTLVSAWLCTVIMIVQFLNLRGRKYKKPLVWTNRAKRIFATMWLITVLIIAPIAVWCDPEFVLLPVIMALLVASPFILLLANIVLRPVEASINRRYYNEAASILRSMPGLKIIGITGSYGKTSTKHYLYRILQEQFSTTMTPGSFNTPMGVIRTVREHLRPYDEVFICEMGAKNIGDIKEICDLVHPQAGIVTAVGEQHLESFKTIENVQRTKFELVDALPSDGFAVVNNDFPKAADRKVDNVECLRYAVANPEGADFVAENIEYSPDGTTFTVADRKSGKKLTLRTRLVGECNISNLMAALIVALRLGVPEEKIKYAVEQIEQVEHRLNVKRIPGSWTIIDDAFNSNPQGSRMALDVLSRMTGGKRIVITPGMIELGDRQAELNEELGRHAAECTDIAIVVGRYNRDAILAGLAAGPINPENIHPVDTFNEAQALLQRIGRPGDTVLYENDLPDTFK